MRGSQSSCAFAILLIVQLYRLVEAQCDTRQCRPQGSTQKIVLGIVNDTGTCIELYNNSIVLNGPNIVSTQCGLRCAGRSGSAVSWTKPRFSRLRPLSGPGDTAYIDLLSDTSGEFTDTTDEGIYTCSVENGLYILHIGLYNNAPGKPVVTMNVSETATEVVFICVSSKSPATNVMWLRDGTEIRIDQSHKMEQHILTDHDRRLSTYHNILKILKTELISGTYSCNVSNVLGNSVAQREIIRPICFPVVKINSTSRQSVSWTIEREDCLRVSKGAAYSLPLSITGYTLEISGGNCLRDAPLLINLTTNTFELLESDCPNSDQDIRIDNGANYTVQVKSLNDDFNIGSNFSVPQDLQTPPKRPCGEPQNFVAKRRGISSAILSWNSVECHKQNGAILRYHIYRLRDGNIVNKTVNASGESQSEMFSSLCPFLAYEFQIAAENIVGQGPNATYTVSILTEAKIGAISAGALVFLLLILCCIILCCCCYFKQQKKCRSKRGVLIPPDEHSFSNPDELEMETNLTDYVQEEEISPEPVISIFPDNMLASPGEYVIMYVSVHGNPPPSLTWYRDTKSIVSDGTVEVSEDGTLSIPSMEARHIGNYKLVAENEHGSCEAEMELFLESEETPNLRRALSMSLIIDSAPVPLASLEEYVASHHRKCNDPFQHEFLSLLSENSGQTVAGEMPENKALNRFKHIVPYDSNRVVLMPLSGYDDCQHDYINASYLDGHNQAQKFIATQGPLPHTVTDFWRMVWQENVPLIIMLCNTVEGHRVRCQQYWPSRGSQNYGPFSVRLETEHRMADYVLRSFKIMLSGTTAQARNVEQYQFTSWPDQLLSENSSPVLTWHKKALSNFESKGPILVHCSAGIGRTGSFIALDRALEQVKEGVVDVMGIVNDMRQQRMKMVQTLAQYIDIYDSVLEHVVCGETKIDAVNLRVDLKRLRTVDQNSGQTELEKQFQILQKITPSPLEFVAAKSRDFMSRSMEFLPRDNRRVVLFGGGGEYIHATFVDGYKEKKAFIVTQGPSEETCNEFWKMVYQYNCGTVVMLSDMIEHNKQVCSPYWPKAGSEDYGDYNVEFMNEMHNNINESLTIREFQITCTTNESKNERPHPVTQFQILNWTPDGQCSNFLAVTKLLEEVTKNQIKTGNHPIVVHCSDAVGRSAIFCAALSVIEQCKTEVAIDVFHAVKSIRMQKPGAIVSVEQYVLIYDIVLTYLDSMDNYDNFTRY